MKEKKYYVSNFYIQPTNGLSGISANLTIQIPNPDDLKVYNNLHALENMEYFLSGLPDWCTPEMMHLALKEKYPEQYL